MTVMARGRDSVILLHRENLHAYKNEGSICPKKMHEMRPMGLPTRGERK